MDGTIHTLIATGLLFAAFTAGKFFGKQEGEMYVWDIIGNIFNAVKIEINESGEMIVTDVDGKVKQVK